MLLLIPFCDVRYKTIAIATPTNIPTKAPWVNLGHAHVGKPTTARLLINNPTHDNQELHCPPPHGISIKPPMPLSVPAMATVALQLSWTPTRPGTIREALEFVREGHGALQVVLYGAANPTGPSRAAIGRTAKAAGPSSVAIGRTAKASMPGAVRATNTDSTPQAQRRPLRPMHNTQTASQPTAKHTHPTPGQSAALAANTLSTLQTPLALRRVSLALTPHKGGVTPGTPTRCVCVCVCCVKDSMVS